MKRSRGILVVILLVVAAGIIYAATVTKETESRTKLNISLSEGDRIIIIKAGYDKTYVRVTPTSFKVEDYKVPAGKNGNGTIFIK